MRTCSYFCPHCKARLLFLSLKPPTSEKVDCGKCGMPYLLTSKALIDAWAHSFALGGYFICLAFLAIGSLLRFEFRALLMAPFLALGAAFLMYVIALPIGAQMSQRILAKSSGHPGIKTIKIRSHDDWD